MSQKRGFTPVFNSPKEKHAEESSQKPKMKKLSCVRPNSPNLVQFDITEESNSRKKFYEIGCPTSMADYYTVEKQNNDNYFLRFDPFDCTLDNWLSGREVWCETYRDWGEYRPEDGLRKVLRGLVSAVIELHSKNQFHGALDYLENYGLRFVEGYSSEVDNESVEVILLYRSGVNNTKMGCNDPNVVTRGIEKDMTSLCEVIFDKILKVENQPIAKDLKDLRTSMEDASSLDRKHEAEIFHLQSIIASHPSLWHWRSKLNFPGKLWTKYIHNPYWENDNFTILDSMKTVAVAYDWKSKIPADSPLHKMLLAKPYANDQIGVLHFLRNVCGHINDRDRDQFQKKKYFDEVTQSLYSNAQYVEKVISDTFPSLLVEVNEALNLYGIQIQ